MSFRLPTGIPRLRYDRIGWVIFLIAIVGILLHAVSRKKANALEEDLKIEIVPLEAGSSLITERDVRNTIRKGFSNKITGQLLKEVDVDKLENFVKTDPFVANADAYLDINNQLHVRIEQREPLLRVLDSQGGNYYLDKSGAKIPISNNYTARVIVATGNLPPYTADFMEKKQHGLRDLIHLHEAILKDDFLRDFVQQIHLSSTGDFIMIPLVGDQQIILGSAKNLDDKFDKLKIFYKDAMPYTGWRTYRKLDLRFKNQVVGVK